MPRANIIAIITDHHHINVITTTQNVNFNARNRNIAITDQKMNLSNELTRPQTTRREKNYSVKKLQEENLFELVNVCVCFTKRKSSLNSSALFWMLCRSEIQEGG